MAPAKDMPTVTMAELYAQQGYYRKAVEIYRRLLRLHPEREDLRKALSQAEEELTRRPVPSRKELGLMLKEWVGLMERRTERTRKTTQP
jgi:tetratricopeptide (TPR) repeat protein